MKKNFGFKFIILVTCSLWLTDAFSQDSTWSVIRNQATLALASFPTTTQVNNCRLTAAVKLDITNAIAALQAVLNYQATPSTAVLRNIYTGLTGLANNYSRDVQPAAEALTATQQSAIDACKTDYTDCNAQTHCTTSATTACLICLTLFTRCLGPSVAYAVQRSPVILIPKAPIVPTKSK